ncbi:MAG TPA: glycosyltransferase family 2 protein [Micropepsaceae bacterium]|jgi:glycosyltransferase involved in cell wall biosynthesis|nr:glycosyltransferase family 2 protein [Micropepsaceae bacterium]
MVSIVTVALNAAPTLARTIASVQAQSFPSIEHIIVDGGSSDGTLDTIRNSIRAQDYWISEKDNGISDAFNKGVALARGHYVQMLNADDWLSPDQIQLGVAALEKTGADFIFGDLIFYEGEAPVFHYAGDPHYARSIHRRCPSIGHPTVLASRAVFERIGLFDTAYRNAMDYDWLLRLHRAGGRGAYCATLVGHMTHAGVSNRQFARTIDEVKRIAIANGRNWLLANIEAQMRHLKTAAAQPIKRRFHPFYSLVRRLINPSYRAVVPSEPRKLA